MSFLSKILGGGAIKEGMKIADKAFYTTQEKEENAIKLAEAYGQNSTASSKARRFMMKLFSIPFILCFVTGFFYLLLGKNTQVNNIINYVNTWNMPFIVTTMVLCYFGRQALAEREANKRIKNLTLLREKEIKNKETDPFLEQNKKLLVKHEGLKLKPYRCTANKLTIGVGRNLEDRGITEDEAFCLLENDIKEVLKDLKNKISFYDKLKEKHKIVLINMAFNLGIAGLLKFKNFLSALRKEDFKEAKKEMLNSKWAKQVGRRADELADMIA